MVSLRDVYRGAEAEDGRAQVITMDEIDEFRKQADEATQHLRECEAAVGPCPECGSRVPLLNSSEEEVLREACEQKRWAESRVLELLRAYWKQEGIIR